MVLQVRKQDEHQPYAISPWHWNAAVVTETQQVRGWLPHSST
jgi:hypothetical protein